MIGIAGIVRDVPDLGERFTMLTTEPGPDVASDWRAWLDPSIPAREIIGPAPAGTLWVRAAQL
jgi:putative SOS response-associated peptidase YedK